MYLWTPFTIVLSGLVHRALSQNPISLPWSSTSYGPDGPWQAVQVSVGASNVSLYPSGGQVSYVLLVDACADGSGDCTSRKGGLYDVQASQRKNDSGEFDHTPPGSWQSRGIMNFTDNGTLLLDDIAFVPNESRPMKVAAERMLLWALDSLNSTLPSGFSYAQRIGSLALGQSPSPYKVKMTNQAAFQDVQTFIGALQQTHGVPSNSWGLHSGSAKLGIPPSLTIGGYDMNRAVGAVLTQSFSNDDHSPIAYLNDIRVVLNGSESAPSRTSSNLMAANGTNPLPVTINPSVPYLFLPEAVCAGMAQWLQLDPVSKVNLYTWNTANDIYTSMRRTSGSALQLHFTTTTVADFVIKVPLSLLDLTLEPPLSDVPTPYLPCAPMQPNKYALGRAFLQAAYLAVDFDQQQFHLAQAPGPGLNRTENLTALTPGTTALSTAPEASFAASWSDAPESAAQASGTAPPSKPPSQDLLSSGAIAGIVGALAGALGLSIAAALLIQRARPRKGPSDEATRTTTKESMQSDAVEAAEAEVVEAGGPEAAELSGAVSVEADGKAVPVEMDSLGWNAPSKNDAAERTTSSTVERTETA